MTHSDDIDNSLLARQETAGAVTPNTWKSLRRYTAARIGLGRAGVSQPTSEQLDFQLAHACAQDAVKKPIDWSLVEKPLQQLGIPILYLNSQAFDRHTYLQRPDLGRRLSPKSEQDIRRWCEQNPGPVDNCLVIADGLSAFAVERQAAPMVSQLIADMASMQSTCSVICLVNQGRVAIGDEIAQLLEAELLSVFVGERPGLSSPDSLGIYFTYQARSGFHDALRNCISNIRPEGLSFTEASQRLIWLMKEARRLKYRGCN